MPTPPRQDGRAKPNRAGEDGRQKVRPRNHTQKCPPPESRGLEPRCATGARGPGPPKTIRPESQPARPRQEAPGARCHYYGGLSLSRWRAASSRANWPPTGPTERPPCGSSPLQGPAGGAPQPRRLNSDHWQPPHSMQTRNPDHELKRGGSEIPPVPQHPPAQRNPVTQSNVRNSWQGPKRAMVHATRLSALRNHALFKILTLAATCNLVTDRQPSQQIHSPLAWPTTAGGRGANSAKCQT